MEDINIYEDVSNINLGNEIHKLEEQNKQLLNHIHKLEGDIEKLCTELTNMKQVQKNLSRNISELFKTAKLEIQRKDKMIAELRTQLDNLMLGKRNNFRTFKRQLQDELTNNHYKRHKSNTSENEIDDDRKANCGSTKSSSKELKDNVEENNGKDVKIQHKDDYDFKQNSHRDSPNRKSPRNDDCSHRNSPNRKSARNGDCSRRNSLNRKSIRNDDSSHRNSPNRKSSRDDDKHNNRGRNNERYRRSKSNDRYGRSKSRNRRRRSTSYNKYRRSKSIGRSNRNHNDVNKNIQDRSEDKKSRSRSTDSRSSNKKTGKRSRSKSNHRGLHIQRCVSNTLVRELPDDNLQIIDLDLEDGEIAGETDKLSLTENNQNQDNCNNDRYIAANELHLKSITIEEYRNRQKPPTNNKVEDCLILETEQNPVAENKNMRNDDNNSEKDVEHIEKVPLENNNKNFIPDDAKELTNNVTSNDLTYELSKSCNDNDNVFNNSSSLNNSNNNSLNNSNNSSLNNSGINNSLKVRRRRCVVIGIKNKT